MKKEIKVVKSVRHNINLLDRAMFIPSRKLAKNSEYDDGNGFKISMSSRYTLPTMFDKKLLYMLICQVQDSESGETLRFNSISSMLDKFGMKGGKNVLLANESLFRWANVTLTFDIDEYYEDGRKLRSAKVIHVMNISISNNGVVYIRFDSDFLKLSKDSYSRMINTDVIKQIESPFSLRLFEILIKAFHNRDICPPIKLETLFKKAGADYSSTRRSEAIDKLNKAIEELRNTKSKLSRIRYMLIPKTDKVHFWLR